MKAGIAWIAIGSNIPSRTANLERLRQALQSDGVRIEASSSVIVTRPSGFTRQEDFHNQVLRMRAPEPWTPRRWLQHCKKAELLAGRRESFRWGPRRADADILLLGEHGEVEVHQEDLTIPHLALATRPYLTRLLVELGFSELIHPR
jgi:2-amino-4-hydroxy-6-hydroxymethyldihydropteridine diphosphokinase